MNRFIFEYFELIKVIHAYEYKNQRLLAEILGVSSEKINKVIKFLKSEHLVDEKMQLTNKALEMIDINLPKRAIILAAGNGLRMIPINTNVPKALLKVNGEILIERIINQLREVGINEIYIVVGYMKEEFEYLIDKFGVKLLVNSDYANKNNLYSLYIARNQISNSYIIPCDLYFKENPFTKLEIQSWYMVSTEECIHSTVYLNERNELIKRKKDGNQMVGLAYINKTDSNVIKKRLKMFVENQQHIDSYWEDILYNQNKMIIYGKQCIKESVYEINTFEDLRNIDSSSTSLYNSSIELISDVFDTENHNIINITYLKKGMTNRSFLFECENNKYIMRIPGEGTDELINRKEEYEVYKKIKSLNICDDIIYMNPKNGYKITKFISNARTCIIDNQNDLINCMKVLKKFHEQNLVVDNYFDLYKKIDFYEKLRGTASLFHDYKETKRKILYLKGVIDKIPKNISLTHIDAVPDNFLIYEENGKEYIKLIDWEYAAMQDPHVDIAMFCIYALYDKEHVDQLIDIYFENNCLIETRIKIYCYIAVCGLLWSNWCEYKYTLGVEFGEYSLAQYRYAKEYYRIVQDELRKRNHKCIK